MSWKIKIAGRVLKEVKKFPEKDAERLLFVLEDLTGNPYQGGIEKIKGEENVWRRRIGAYNYLRDNAGPKIHLGF